MSLPFQTLGRSRQAQLSNASHLAEVLDLPDALWVATAAPIAALKLDPVFLGFVDGDGDGRIRSDELRGAIRFALDHLARRDGIDQAADTLNDDAIQADAAQGQALIDAMRRIRGDLGKEGALSLADVRGVRKAEEAKGLSAAGRVLPAAAGDDAALADFLNAVIALTGGEPHPSGDPAVTAPTLDRFLDEAKAFLAWHDQGVLPEVGTSEIKPLADDTAAASDALAAVADKLDQYFLLCDAIALDPELAAAARVDPSGTDLLDPKAATGLLERAPIAPPTAAGVLDPKGPVNPAWRARLQAFVSKALTPLLGDRPLDRAAVADVSAALAPFRTWSAAKPTTKAAEADLDTLRQQSTDTALAERTRELLAASDVAAVALDGVKLVEKLMLYQRDLLKLANNLVAIPDLFVPDQLAAMERGRLIFDGRELTLSVQVFDRARAERFAKLSPMFILFVQTGEKGGALTEEFMVPVTAGEREHLLDGQWGIHFDRDGTERHAYIRTIAASPISIKEALLAPFRKLNDAIQGAFDKAATSQTTAVNSQVTSQANQAATRTSTAAETARTQGEAARAAQSAPAQPAAAPAAAEAPAAESASNKGSSLMGSLPLLLAGAGVALAALAGAATMVFTMLGAAASYLAELMSGPFTDEMGQPSAIAELFAFPLAIVLVGLGVLAVPLLMYAVPVSIATWLRLRRRDLATLLEGTGWAINTRLYLDRPLANQLTKKPKKP